ncbi:hypothetical protein C5F49_07185 [Nitrosopumilus oxyclinae]|uniref:Uncharacterized protein n=1 Tax=Nitrosopumilus oxyclinae TaxID=1959104 RepID=A0A7D5M579_9ARCH|nr:hypothetical protein [Nitrosopumilus oxyclinae]QLH05127.1 hypothetical protein C5F49_07185 [Nitrosopumilus oxyclinae]
MATKDKLNKISGIIALGMFAVIISGYFTDNESLLGFPNTTLLYALMPLALIWFGTRKNGCGSCNQTCDISKAEQEKK